MPASTGTEGRGGRLRAVQATASASTSRATRNFISRPTSAQPVPVDGGVPSPSAGPLVLICGSSVSLHIVPGAVVLGETAVPPRPVRAPFQPRSGPSGTGSPPRLGFEKTSRYLPHPRHH